VRKSLLIVLSLTAAACQWAAADSPKLPYEGVDGLVEFVHRARQAIAVERVYQIETKEEFVLAKDQAARLTFEDNPAGLAEFLFVYDGNAVHVIYRCRGETEREYNSTWLDLNRREDSRGVYATGVTTYLKCSTSWEPKDGQASVRFHTEKPSEQEQQKFLKTLQEQEEYKKQMQAVREQAIALREWDPNEKVEPYTITMDDPNDPNMVELRTKYGLEDLVRGEADDYEKLKRVLAWVQTQWEHNGNNSPSKPDPLTILREVSEGKRFRCVEYAIVVTGCTRSLGMSSRTLGLMRSDVETAESGAGHVVAEVWLRQFGKWVMVDGQWGAIAESKGVPLNAVEVQDAIARKDPGLTIRFVSQTATADRQANYIEWIIPYLYYLNFGCDQRFYRSAAQGQPSQRGVIMLVPKGADKPKAFQRHASFRDARYISNPKAFYPPMDKAVSTQPHETGVKAALPRPSGGWIESNAWTIIGPFDNADGAGFDTPYAPEKEIDFSKEYTGKEGRAKWFKPTRTRADGLIDLAALLGPKDWAVAYAATSVQSPEARKMELRVGSDDDVKAWLNGEPVLSRSADRAAVPDEDIVSVTLRKGENQLLLKVCNRLYSWGFYARVVDANVPRHAGGPPAATITRQGAVEDLDFLVGQLKAKHPRPFAKVSESNFSREVERTKANLPEELPVKDFSLSVAALLAMVGDDHTRHQDLSAFYEHVSKGGKVFPVKFRYRDGYMTVEAWSPEVSPARMRAGDSVTAVNGEPIESLLHRYARYLSRETDIQKWWILERGFEIYQVLLGDIRDQYTLQMQDSEGRTYSETLPAVKPWLEQYERSKPQAPRFHHQFYEDGKVCLFKLQTFNWGLRAELEAKANTLVDEMKQKGTQIAILDLRGNDGGNSNMGYMVFAKMVDKPYGELRPDSNHSWPVKLALLCDRSTYSAASFEAMFFKDYKMGIIAGEETGGRASSFGDIVHVRLPNSFLTCGIATGYFPRRAGTDDGRGVLPDLPLDVTLDDGVLVEKICAYIRSHEAPADKPL